MNDNWDISQITLDADSLSALTEIADNAGISDEKIRDFPYDFLLRLGLIEHGYSDKFPYTYPQYEITIPCNALKLTDKGRLFLILESRKQEEEKKRLKRELLVGITSAAIGAMLTLVIEHFTEIVSFLSS